MRLAVTGATGFVGSHLIDAALAEGHEVSALARREQSPRQGVTWVGGDLHDRAALDRLVGDTDAVIHVAGVISAHRAEAFEKGNIEGTQTLLEAAAAGGTRRFVHVSSLAAREPMLSLYGASKCRSEELVMDSGLDWSIVRPPAVYGPGDRETLELFRMAKLGVMLMPPRGHVSVLHARDLAHLLVSLTRPEAVTNLLIEPDDGKQGGWTHREFAQALGVAVGTKPTIVSSPGFLLRFAARADQLLRREKAKLTVDRAAYFSHRNWVVEPRRAAPQELWRAQIETLQGLRDTAFWYRQQGWL